MNITSKFSLYLSAILCVILAPVLWTSQTIGNFGDLFNYYLPLRFWASLQLSLGHFPFWDPHRFGGTPFFANPQTAVLYPFSVLFYFFPCTQAIKAQYAFHFFQIGLFTYLALQAAGFNRRGCWFGGLGSPVLPIFTLKLAQGGLTILSGLAYLPLIVLGIQTLIQGRRTSLISGLLGFSILLQLFSGHPQPLFVTGWILFWICGLKLFHIAYSDRKRFLILKGLLLCLTWIILIGLIQILPTTQFLKASIRTGFFTPFATSYSLSYKNLLNLFSLTIWGNPLQGNFSLGNGSPSIFFETCILYIGIIPLVLAFIGLFITISHRRYSLLGLICFSLVLALGDATPIYSLFLRWCPPLNFLRVPARFAWGSLWGLSLVSIIGWQRISQAMSRWTRLFLCLLAFIDLGLTSWPFLYKQDARPILTPNAASRFLQNHANEGRLLTDKTVANPNHVLFLGLSNITGYDALFLKNPIFYFAHYIHTPFVTSVGLDLSNHKNIGLESIGVRYILSATLSTEGTGKVIYHQKPWTIYECMARPYVFIEGPFITNVVKHYDTPTRFSFEAQIYHSSQLVWVEAFYPDWHAYYSGHDIPIQIWHDFGQSIRLLPGLYLGSHQIYIRYFSYAFIYTLVSVVVAFAIGGLTFIRWARIYIYE